MLVESPPDIDDEVTRDYIESLIFVDMTNSIYLQK